LAPAQILNLASPPKKNNRNDDNSTEDADTTSEEADLLRRATEAGGEDRFNGVEEEEDVEFIGDLPDAIISEADFLFLLDTVYGDHVHQNPGAHLDGGVSDDTLWQNNWRGLVIYTSQQYNVPTGAVGRLFIEKMAELLEGVQNRRWNSEMFLVFLIVVMHRTCDVKQAQDIKNEISWRIDAWEAGKFAMLIQDTEQDMQSFLSSKQGNTSPKLRA
jgi:hypothetical protein